MIRGVFPGAAARRQRGAVALMLAVLMLLVISTALLGSLRLSGSTLVDTTANDALVASLFLAESGVERAHATLAQRVLSDDYGPTVCAALQMAQPSALGRGGFQITQAELSANQNCRRNAGLCDVCRVTSVGEVVPARRVISALFEIPLTKGVEGRSSTTDNLFMKIAPPGNAATITALTLRSKDGGGSSATVDACNFTSPVLDGQCVSSWADNNTGEGKVVGLGVFAPGLPMGQHGVNASFTNNQGAPATRPYVLVGALVYPRAGESILSQGRQTLSQTTSANSICGGSSLSDGLARAAQADTLVHGFSGLKLVGDPSMVDQLGVALSADGPSHALMTRLAHLSGSVWEVDRLYGQIWYAHNPAWTGATASAAAGSQQVVLSASSLLPSVGTVVAGMGFNIGTTQAMGRIVGDRLTLSTAAPLALGDVVSGPNVRANTRVVAVISDTEYTVAPPGRPEAAVWASVVARAAVASASGNTLVMSRPVAAGFSGTLCGGLCALFYNGAGVLAPAFQRLYQNLPLSANDKWASGYECLSGVEPAAVKALLPPVRRLAWSEVLP